MTTTTTILDTRRSAPVGFVSSVKEFGDWLGPQKNQKWVQIFPFDTWDHPVFGETTVDVQKAQHMVDNFKGGVRGIDVHTDYEHGQSAAHGTKASGKYVDMQIREDGLYGLIEFTEPAVKEIDAGEWNYFSGAMYEDYTDSRTQKSYGPTLVGGGVTNMPWVKGMSPLNFSELLASDENLRREFADWSTAYKDNLPDSSFLYIAPGGSKDSSGKTKPRSLRSFPVKDANGKVDLDHVRKVTQLAPRSDVPDAVKSRVIATAKRMLGSGSGSKEMSEIDVNKHLPKTYVAKRFSVVEAIDIPTAEHVVDGIGLNIVEDGSHGLLEITAEMAPQYYQEPGTGYADPLINHDDAADSGSRLNTPPEAEDGSVPAIAPTVNPGTTGFPEPAIDSPDDPTPAEQIPQVDPLDPGEGSGEESDIETSDPKPDIVNLNKGGEVMPEGEGTQEIDLTPVYEALGLESGASLENIVTSITKLNDEVAPLRELKVNSEKAKAFSEQFPEEYARMERMEKRDREVQAKEFSEGIGKLRFDGSTESGDDNGTVASLGLSGKSLTAVEGLYKSFSESKATPTAFREVMETILGEGGMVDFGTHGSSREPVDHENPVKAFSEAINKIVAEDKVEYGVAIGLAAQQNPELYQAWQNSKRTVANEAS